MAELTVVYWRDIPAQVIVGSGRRGAKAPLPERFEQAIDRCAMKIGAKDSDAYMAEWRKVSEGEATGDPQEAATNRAEELVSQHGPDLLKALIDNLGWRSAAAVFAQE